MNFHGLVSSSSSVRACSSAMDRLEAPDPVDKTRWEDVQPRLAAIRVCSDEELCATVGATANTERSISSCGMVPRSMMLLEFFFLVETLLLLSLCVF